MATFTKRVLADTLKKMMSEKPLTQITVKDLVETCSINRQTFYYHFQDIYELLGWIYQTEAIDSIENYKSYATWQQGLSTIFQYVQDNHILCISTYRSLGREHLERFLNDILNTLIGGVVEELAEPYQLSKDHKAFIIKFYSYAFTGTLLEWIGTEMKTPYEEIVKDISITVKGNVLSAIKGFQK